MTLFAILVTAKIILGLLVQAWILSRNQHL